MMAAAIGTRSFPILELQSAALGHHHHRHSLVAPSPTPSLSPSRTQLLRQQPCFTLNFNLNAARTPIRSSSGTSASDMSLVDKKEATPSPNPNPTDDMIQDLLSLVEGSDRGALLDDGDRRKVEELFTGLEKYCIPDPLQSPLLFGDWDVVYSSNPTSTGGYYRSSVARALLKTNQMVQTLGSPNKVGNKVSFSAFNLLDCEVSLQGTLEILDEKSIKVVFNPPNLKLGSLQFQYGGNSSVQISITYLDEKIRLGRGSRGSLFVFKRRM